MTDSNPTCPVCEHESKKSYRCTNCGKLLDESDTSNDNRGVLGESS